MITTLAIANYRSIRELVMPLGPLNVVSGQNGTGKSNLYRALRLLADADAYGSLGLSRRDALWEARRTPRRASSPRCTAGTRTQRTGCCCCRTPCPRRTRCT